MGRIKTLIETVKEGEEQKYLMDQHRKNKGTETDERVSDLRRGINGGNREKLIKNRERDKTKRELALRIMEKSRNI